MTIAEMTAQEMRSIDNPTIDQLCEAVDILIQSGWHFKTSSRGEWNEGWWINDRHSTKCRPVGDSRNFHLAAWDTLKAYVAQ